MQYKIITFYKFIRFEELEELCDQLYNLMVDHNLLGTILLANEGFNGTISGLEKNINNFILKFNELLNLKLEYKTSWHSSMPFSKTKVKIKPEIVTFGEYVRPDKSTGEYIAPKDWNNFISQPDVLTIDTRNTYEIEAGKFTGSLDPETDNFRDIPELIDNNQLPNINLEDKEQKIAMYCTGGIRCEKFSSYLKNKGYNNIYHLKGGILQYLEDIPQEQSMWEGECFVFDDRLLVDHNLNAVEDVQDTRPGRHGLDYN